MRTNTFNTIAGKPLIALAIFSAAATAPAAAFAHVGHLAEVAGHGHWLAGVAIGAAIAIGLAQGLRGKSRTDEAAESDEIDDEDLQEA